MEEFLNKIHYGIFSLLLNLHEKEKVFFLKITPQRYKPFIRRNQIRTSRTIYYDSQNGFAIKMVNHLFGYFYSGYSLFFSFILFGIKGMLCEIDDKVLTLIILGVPVFIGYIPAYRAVFTNDNYLKYYKKFEKKDARWHKKCKWITVAFCVGSILATALGFLLMAVLVSI